MAHPARAQEEIYAELKGHLKETDSSAPFPKGPWLYFHTTKEGLSYKARARRPAIPLPPRGGIDVPRAGRLSLLAPPPVPSADALPQASRGLGSPPGHPRRERPRRREELLHRARARPSPPLPFSSSHAHAHPHTLTLTHDALRWRGAQVGAVAEAPSSDRIAYSVDNVGFETYELRVRDVSGADVDQSGAADVLVAPETEGSAEWGADDSALFYVTMDECARCLEA